MKANEIVMMIEEQIADYEKDVVWHEERANELGRKFIKCEDESEKEKLAKLMKYHSDREAEAECRAGALRMMVGKIENKAGHLL